MQFWGFSVLQRHGVSPPGGEFFHGAFLFGDRKLKFMAAARGKRSQKHHFLWVSEVTLGIFGVQFWGFSVLQRHGVSPPGGDFSIVFSYLGTGWQVIKIHSSSKRKKEPNASLSMGFRSHVRHFRGAILALLRPSEAWCFAPGR